MENRLERLFHRTDKNQRPRIDGKEFKQALKRAERLASQEPFAENAMRFGTIITTQTQALQAYGIRQGYPTIRFTELLMAEFLTNIPVRQLMYHGNTALDLPDVIDLLSQGQREDLLRQSEAQNGEKDAFERALNVTARRSRKEITSQIIKQDPELYTSHYKFYTHLLASLFLHPIEKINVSPIITALSPLSPRSEYDVERRMIIGFQQKYLT